MCHAKYMGCSKLWTNKSAQTSLYILESIVSLIISGLIIMFLFYFVKSLGIKFSSSMSIIFLTQHNVDTSNVLHAGRAYLQKVMET